MKQSHEQSLKEMKRVAVFGASEQPDSKGYLLVQHLIRNGFHPLPINPRISEIDNTRCFGNLDEVPSPAEAALVSVDAEATLEILKSCKVHNVRVVWLEPESESDDACQYAKDHGITTLTGETFLNCFGAAS
jgi:predicted CoA-binding protein